MTYVDPPTMPAMYPPQQYSPPVPAPQRRPRWPWVAGIAAAAVTALIAAVALGFGGNSTGPAAAPEPITRAELMAEYADINPLDSSATPATVDDLAASTCSLLESGTSTDALIEQGTEYFQTNATAVMQLLVSYKCPQYLKDFK